MYQYHECIDFCKKDLLRYPKEKLRRLGEKLGLSSNDIDRLTDKIATELIDRNFPIQRGNMTKEELPYGGDMSAARNARDVKAIIAIQKWLNEGEGERARISQEAEKTVVEEAADCENRINYVTNEDWSEDDLPNVKITVWDADDPMDGPRRVLCYTRESLDKWFSDPSISKFANWIPNELGKYIDQDGHGGGPGKTILYKFLGSLLLVFAQDVDLNFTAGRYNAIPVAKDLRYGNVNGIFGVSQQHGQYPGAPAYVLIPVGEDYETIIKNIFVDDLVDREYRGGFDLLQYVLSDPGPYHKIYKDFIRQAIRDSDWNHQILNQYALDVPDEELQDQAFDIFKREDNDAATQFLIDWFEQDSRARFVEEYYPAAIDAGIEDAYYDLIENLPLFEVIQASQELWSLYPERDDDYTPEGIRRGPVIERDDFDDGSSEEELGDESEESSEEEFGDESELDESPEEGIAEELEQYQGYPESPPLSPIDIEPRAINFDLEDDDEYEPEEYDEYEESESSGD